MKSELVPSSREIINAGSKSFSFAAKLFDKETFESAILLYRWCRFCDDAIDQSEPAAQAEKIKYLRQQTEEAVNGNIVTEPAFVALREIVKKYSIPAHYPIELINGLQMDVENHGYETYQDLKLYCYRVAGVVGLMMAHIMKISDEKALSRACDMGMAMQLTNIARDVFTDASLNRIYLPKSWLIKHQVPYSPKSFSVSIYHGRLAAVTRLLLNEADELYKSGDQGLEFLSLRAQIAILSARYIYSDIGRIVRNRGALAWRERAYVNLPMKVFWVAVSFCKVMYRSFWLPRFEPITIRQIWRCP